jgi:hypothetical protein
MKKIIIEKEEGIAEAIERILAEPDTDITLVVPKGSTLGRSVKNFHLLRREVDGAGKEVVVESVDDTILAFAKDSGLESSHPLWRGVQASDGGGMADILPVRRNDSGDKEEEEERSSSKKRKKKVAPVRLTVRTEEATVTEMSAGADEEAEEEAEKEIEREEWNDDEPRRSRKLIWGGIAALIVVFGVLGVMTWSFGRVGITINFKKNPWSYQGAFLADKSVSKANAANKVIPAQVFSTQKNTTQSFAASGNANVSVKAQGTITIYNAYSSAPQQLVATTRFVTPDGKLFRLVSTVTVPGASITNGQIVPSSIEVAVVADQAGPTYNVGAVPKLTIPGFQGSPKYNAFYGALPNGTSGGFIGKRAVPTAADIAAAKDKISSTLQANLKSDLTTSYPNNFKILDGATAVQVTKLTVNSATDANGNFTVYGEATLQAIGFDENAFKALLLSIAQDQQANSVLSSVTLTYSGVKPDFTKGNLTFSVAAQGMLEPAFSADDFKGSITGKSIGDARAAIAALPDLADGKISVWPMWLWNVPGSPDKIEVNAN